MAKHEPRSLASPINFPVKAPKNGAIRAVIETPKGSRNKYAYDPELGVFYLKRVLPAGMTFPYDFGFVPRTIAGDGDPLDILVLMDEPAYPGCLVEVKVIGIIEGEQRADGKRDRNDRVVAVETHNHRLPTVTRLSDLGKHFVKEVEAFFVNYHDLQGEKYRILDAKGRSAAMRCIKRAHQAARHR